MAPEAVRQLQATPKRVTWRLDVTEVLHVRYTLILLVSSCFYTQNRHFTLSSIALHVDCQIFVRTNHATGDS